MVDEVYSTKSYAKVNLFLHITSKLASGFHEIYSLLVPVDIYDTITIENSSDIVLRCSDTSIPVDESNTILRTDSILRSEYGLIDKYEITLDKRVPSGAGLGGGSSNAAAYLRLVNDVAGLDLTRDNMVDIMSQVGSDTVFFIDCVPAIASGRGETIERYDNVDKLYLLIINPEIHISTKDVYTSGNVVFSDKSAIKQMTDRLTFKNLQGYMFNGLERSTFSIEQKVSDIKDSMQGRFGGIALMSGSGSSVFAVYPDKLSRDEAYEYFCKEYDGYKLFCTETV